MRLSLRNYGKQMYNKALKRDSCRVAFLACVDLSGENGLREIGLGGIRPLTRRYKIKIEIRV
ncbi:DUF3265 domain-containing protein [Vibrio vulnificus]|nr:DUF3265 domain-containing protein [Vibrio vulnificus]EIO3971578.1 DUF3265 domain-containing protein [Vibrio vulnificus]ELO5516970.1 DUF3265 domain-containing protein [Vibrio vulnificus]MCU8360823.1 DUF3265 domain-containing protein [Vibrio vulnificus]